jgi:hypothetical protein
LTSILISQIEKEIKVGIIKPPIKATFDWFSCVFPFAAQMLVKGWYKFLI